MNKSQSAQKYAPNLTASRQEAELVSASGVANSNTREPHSASAVARIANLRAMCLLPLVRFMSRKCIQSSAGNQICESLESRRIIRFELSS
jgi:hypothetical protein